MESQTQCTSTLHYLKLVIRFCIPATLLESMPTGSVHFYDYIISEKGTSSAMSLSLIRSSYSVTGFIQASMSKIQGFSRTSNSFSNSFQGLMKNYKVNEKY